MSNYFTKAVRKQGDTGLFMQQMLEQRLDNAVYRLGLARSRDEARQTVGHGFILVNGRKVSIPSYQAKVGDRITLKKGAETSKRFQELPQLQDKESEKLPSWLIRESQFEGKVVGLPQGDDLAAPFDMKIIVEFYSR